MESERPPGEWRDGWLVVAAGLIGMTVMGLHTGALGVMLKPLNELFGWSRSEISAGLTILTLVQIFVVPAVGVLLPRVGIRRIALLGAALYALGMLTLSFSAGNIWVWYLGWVLMSVALGGVGPLSWTTAVTRAFDKHRGIALSICLSGVGVAALLSPLISAFALQFWGWRGPFVALSALCAVILLPLLWWFMRHSSYFDPYEARAALNVPAQMAGDKLHILRDVRLWQLTAASFLMAACAGMIIVHLQAMMRDAGASATQAAGFMTIIGPMLIVGRLISGVLLDRFPTRVVAAGLFLLPAICSAMLLTYEGSPVQGILICVIFGIGYGSENDILAYIASRFFQPRDYPVVYGVVYSAFGLGYGVSAMVAGAMFDRLGSYDRILQILIGCVLVGVVLILTLKTSPHRSQPVLTPAE